MYPKNQKNSLRTLLEIKHINQAGKKSCVFYELDNFSQDTKKRAYKIKECITIQLNTD